METNSKCHLHWRKAGCLSEANIGIFVTKWKGGGMGEGSLLYGEREMEVFSEVGLCEFRSYHNH